MNEQTEAAAKARLLASVIGYRAPRTARPSRIEPAGPGTESVWDYPRPPEIRPAGAPLRVDFAGRTVAATERGLRVVETSGAPVYYFPPEDVAKAPLRPSTAAGSVCEWKGEAVYYDLVAPDGRISAEAAFAYPDPFDDLGQGYERIAGWVAFYAGRVDGAWVGDEQARPQPGGYYAGWVTNRIKGPIKGAPGSEGW